MSNNASNKGGSIEGDNNASNIGGSIRGDNNSSNKGGSIGEDHEHEHEHDDHEDDHRDGNSRDGSGCKPKVEYATYFGETLPADGVTLAFPVTHNLGTRDTIESVYNPITGLQYTYGIVAGDYTVIHTSDNVTTFIFVTAPLPGTANVVIVAGT